MWPGQPMTAHWGIEDPAAVTGSDEEKQKAFFRAYSQLQTRISYSVNLPLIGLDGLSYRKS